MTQMGEGFNHDKSFLLMYRIVVLLNIFYYLMHINQNIGMFSLMPLPIETHQGLVARIPFLHYFLNTILLLHCLFINHWYLVFLYIIVLLIELIFAVALDHMFMVGYSWGETAWGVAVLITYLIYRWNDLSPNDNP